jgi:flagellar export protein FliJ
MFRFRLQQVLDLREQTERTLASQLVQALDLERMAQAQLEGLQASRLASAERAALPGQSRPVGELANLAFVLEQLDGQIEHAIDTVAAAGDAVTEVKEALTVAFQDRRVLDRLRERHEEHHRASEDQLDRRTMDDIALTRYTHHDTP